MSEEFLVSNFYKFCLIENPSEIKINLQNFCELNEIKGTILIGEEGINGSLSATKINLQKFYNFIRNFQKFQDLIFKESISSFKPFKRLKIKIKKEIVTMGIENLDMSQRGKYLNADEWEKIIVDNNTYTIDTRNNYEIELGTFKGALNPNIRNFREFPKWSEENLPEDKDAKIAMFCTGGIRCEKSTAYLINKGYKNIYHLEGGILKYLEVTKNKNELWQGKCFVFDDRYAVNDKIEAIIGSDNDKKTHFNHN